VADQPFAGVRVLEFGQFVAVPVCSQYLADGGAEVVKVEPHEGDPTRGLAPLVPHESRHFISRNRGKHSLPLDLRHPLAARILTALIERSDVVLLNLRPGLGAAGARGDAADSQSGGRGFDPPAGVHQLTDRAGCQGKPGVSSVEG